MKSTMLLAVLFAVSCGPLPPPPPPPPPGALPPDQLRVKLKRYQQDQRHERKFLVGFAEGTNLQAATQRAYDAITRQVQWVPAGGRELLVGHYRVDKSPQDSEGTYHVLAVLSRQAAGGHLQNKRDEELKRLRAAVGGCRKLLDSCDIPGVRSCLGQLEAQLKKARDVHLASRAVEGDSSPSPIPEAGSVLALKARLDRVAANRGSMLVHVLKSVDGKPAGNLDASFQAVVSKGGRRVASGTITDTQVKQAMAGNTRALAQASTDAGAGFVLVGSVDATFHSADKYGQYFAHATGRLKVVDAVCGRTVAQLTVPSLKGGHINRRQACDKAARTVVKQLSARLQRWLQQRR